MDSSSSPSEQQQQQPLENSSLSISVNSDDNGDDDDDGDPSSSSTDCEDLLDPRSSKFSAQLAILCKQSPVSMPCPEAPHYLNVMELEKAIPDPTKEPLFDSVLSASKAKVAKIKERISNFHSKSSNANEGIVGGSSSSSSNAKENNEQSQTSAVASSYKARQAKMQADRLKQQQNNANNLTSSSQQPSASSEIPSTSKQQQKPQEESKEKDVPFYPMPGRKFLPHQMPVYRPRISHPNILTEMENVKGPLSAIKEAMTKKRRIKIWTRGDSRSSGIRGFFTGFVLGFDKHWNLILWDVDEIFQRKRATVPILPKCDPNKSESSIVTRAASLAEERAHCQTFLRTARPPTVAAKQPSTSKLENKGETVTCSSAKPILIEGTDALLACRLHLQALTLNSKTRFSAQHKQNDKAFRSSDLFPHHVQNSSDKDSTTKSQLRKKHLKIFDIPRKDPFGFSVLAQSKNFEIVHRTQKQLFLMGNHVAFIETQPQ